MLSGRFLTTRSAWLSRQRSSFLRATYVFAHNSFVASFRTFSTSRKRRRELGICPTVFSTISDVCYRSQSFNLFPSISHSSSWLRHSPSGHTMLLYSSPIVALKCRHSHLMPSRRALPLDARDLNPIARENTGGGRPRMLREGKVQKLGGCQREAVAGRTQTDACRYYRPCLSLHHSRPVPCWVGSGFSGSESRGAVPEIHFTYPSA